MHRLSFRPCRHAVQRARRPPRPQPPRPPRPPLPRHPNSKIRRPWRSSPVVPSLRGSEATAEVSALHAAVTASETHGATATIMAAMTARQGTQESHSGTATHTHTHTRPAGEGAVLPEGVEWVSEFSKEELSRFVQNPTTDVLVCLLHNDHDNYRAAEVAVDDLGMTKVIVRVLDPRWAVQFQELGVLQVDPMSSMLNMLDHVVRSPASHSFISFNAPETELVHVTGVLPEHVGRQLQHLDWPHDVLVTSIVRGRDWMIPQATTVLEPGDQLILAGSADSIRDVAPPEATAPPPSPVVARRRKLNEQGLDATARPSPLRRTSKPPLPASTATSRLPRCAPLRRHSIGTTRPHLQRPPPWLSPSQAQSLAQGQASEATDRRE
eukprot:gnl/Trimastix_PCT/2395.p1 GENE.gnl/Trimastix_PCT/2395~~gnl/Trimastix_PCT/2395.p1  ORF type:complete len:381 (+),score=79.14 gnl/Trimastix_PCT/2395:531-1673(+)